MESHLGLDPADGLIQSGDDSVSVTMSKKPKIKTDQRIAVTRDERTVDPKPRATSFVARDCTACTAIRDSDPKAKGKSFSRVYATVGRTRYCKCGYCGNTWKQIEDTTP